jgi:hypothetical protein
MHRRFAGSDAPVALNAHVKDSWVSRTTMHSVLGILLGTICSGGASFCLVTWVFRRLNLRLERIEHIGLAQVVGAACLSQIVFFLCSIGAARRNVFLAIALLSAIAVVSSEESDMVRDQAFLSLEMPVRCCSSHSVLCTL